MINQPFHSYYFTIFIDGWWATWATETNRPGDNVTYTNNWSNEDLIGNKPTGEMIVWSYVSFVLLLGAIGGLAWYYTVQKHHEVEETYPDRDPLLALSVTPSMKATQKYFWVVAALWLVQVLLGAITGHYQVEGSGFYGIPLDKWIPYSLTRSWHTQLGILWIATLKTFHPRFIRTKADQNGRLLYIVLA